MKKLFLIAVATSFVLLAAGQNDKPKPPSPPAQAKETLANGTVVTINYSQPSLKGRTMGKDVEPMAGKVWRTGANKATVFDISKDVKIEGQALPAGKYGFFAISGDNEWTLIFNKTWDQWGAFNYKEADDALRVKVKPGKSASFTEMLTYTISKEGVVSLVWGDTSVSFKVE